MTMTSSPPDRAKLHAEFTALADKATQGEVEHFYRPSSGGHSQPTNGLLVDGKDVVVHWTGFDAARAPEVQKRANAAFIAWCFNHRADIASALRAPAPADWMGEASVIAEAVIDFDRSGKDNGLVLVKQIAAILADSATHAPSGGFAAGWAAGREAAAMLCDQSAMAHEFGLDAAGSDHPKASIILERMKLADTLGTSIRALSQPSGEEK